MRIREILTGMDNESLSGSYTVGIPTKLSDLPKKEERQPMVTVGNRMKFSFAKKLKDKSEESGYTQQQIFNMALEAFLK